jgi:predicted DNA-binding protein (UPF0251 family)
VIYSPELLKLMGTNIASDLIKDNHQLPEQKLWRYVILNAVEDARATAADRKTSVYKFDAHNWILSGDEDFNQICWWAAWDPDEVRAQYKKALNNKSIVFLEKHLRWNDYTKLFQKLKSAKDKESRKYLRSKVEEARKKVMEARMVVVTTLFISIIV